MCYLVKSLVFFFGGGGYSNSIRGLTPQLLLFAPMHCNISLTFSINTTDLEESFVNNHLSIIFSKVYYLKYNINNIKVLKQTFYWPKKNFSQQCTNPRQRSLYLSGVLFPTLFRTILI